MFKINTRSNKFYLDAKNGGFYVNKDATPTFSAEGYSRLWCVTEKSSGNITGITQSDTGYYAVKWWDDTINFFENGDTFSKTAAGTKAFEVYPAIRESTSLLLNFNGSNESTVFSETSGNNLIVNAGGNASISTNQSKFGGSSVYFDGSGDYLSVSSSEYLNLTGLVPYTIEFWMYIESYSYSYTTVLTRRVGVNWQYLIGFSEPSTTELFFSATSQGPGVSPGYSQCRSGFSLPIQQWHHVAATVSNGFANFFINGILVDAKPWAFQPDNSADLWLAQQGSGGEFFNGYIDDLRIVKGKAIYGDFDPPSSAHPDSALNDPYWSDTVLLLHMNGANGSTVFTDSSSNALTVTSYGGTEISTSHSKFGGASAQFSGPGSPGSHLIVANDASLAFEASDFTVEFWLRFADASAATAGAYFLFTRGSEPLYFVSHENQSGILYAGSSSGPICYSASTVPDSQWVHIALVRNAGLMRIYVDGVGGTSAASTHSFTQGGAALFAHPDYSQYGNALVGNIDDLRITKSARYTSNFTPPTAPLSPITTQIVPYGQFDGFNISENSITQVRAENITLASSAGQWTGGWPGFWTYWGGYQGGNPGNFIPGVAENGILSNNSLSATAMDQFYSDLSNGTGSLWVDGNPGISSDTPTIVTSKGYTVYGSVPTQTLLLMNFNGSNGSTSFIDSSPNSLTATSAGSPQISTSQSKFGGSSLYVDGSGSYISVAGNGFIFGVDDFTVEFWMKDDGSSGECAFVTTAEPTDEQGFWIGVGGNGNLYWLFGNGTWNFGANPSSTNVRNGNWNHIAVTRNGSMGKIFLNGFLVDVRNVGSLNLTNSNESLSIGGRTVASQYWKGYIDDLRIVKGKAIYGDFDPPTSAHPSSSLTDPYWSNVSLLLHMDGTDGSTVFTDSSSNTLTVTANGNAQIDTGKWKFGGASGRFGQTSTCGLSVPPSAANFLDGDFTIEAWFYPLSSGQSSSGATFNFLLTGDSGSDQSGFVLLTINEDYYFLASDGSGWTLNMSTNKKAIINQWQHVAIVRNVNKFSFYLDGICVLSATNSLSINSPNSVNVGYYPYTNGSDQISTDGYIDELRITKGMARYNSDFTPPTAPLGVYT